MLSAAAAVLQFLTPCRAVDILRHDDAAARSVCRAQRAHERATRLCAIIQHIHYYHVRQSVRSYYAMPCHAAYLPLRHTRRARYFFMRRLLPCLLR